MHKWLFAAAMTSGFLLLGPAPAQADVIPAPADGPLSPFGGGLIPANLLGGGLTPDGRTVAAAIPRESALFDGGVPLLGGLGGLLPANEAPRTPSATGADPPNSMPAGGSAVDEPELPEQPVAGERRSFSDGGRPVAGVDQDFQ